MGDRLNWDEHSHDGRAVRQQCKPLLVCDIRTLDHGLQMITTMFPSIIVTCLLAILAKQVFFLAVCCLFVCLSVATTDELLVGN